MSGEGSNPEVEPEVTAPQAGAEVVADAPLEAADTVVEGEVVVMMADAPAEEPAEPAEPTAEERIEALRGEVADWKTRAQRQAANADNMRKRWAREREDLQKYGTESLLKDLLPVADNLERAVEHAGADADSIVQGVKLVLNQFVQILHRRGATPFEADGKPFDPQFHEAMTQIERDDVEPGTVVQVFQRGWKLHDRLVRPAMVVVSKAPPPPVEPEPESQEAEMPESTSEAEAPSMVGEGADATAED